MIYTHYTPDKKRTLCGCVLAPRNFVRFTTRNAYMVTCRNCKPLTRPYKAFSSPVNAALLALAQETARK